MNVIEDEQIEAIRAIDRRFQRQFPAGDLQLLHELGGAREQHAPAFFQQRKSDGRAQMGFATAWWAEQQEVGALVQPDIPGAQAMTCALEIMGTASKSKFSSVLPGRSLASIKVALDAAPIALGNLMLGQSGEEARGRPAFLVGAFGKLGPHLLDA